jgi:hypothetical protein
MIPRRKGNHAAVLCFGIETTERIVGPTKLERASALQMFPFEKNLNPDLGIQHA